MTGVYELKKATTLGGKKTTSVDLKFEAITGDDILKAEDEARKLGETNPIIAFSKVYQMCIAARLIGCTVEEMKAMNAKDFLAITNRVASFLQ